MKNIKTLINIFLAAFCLFALSGVFLSFASVSAEDSNKQYHYANQQDSAATGSTTTCLEDSSCHQIYAKLADFTNLLSAAVGIICVAMIIYGGIEFSSSSGDPQKAASGKKHITNALIALVAFLFLWAFLNFLLPGGMLNGNYDITNNNPYVNQPGAQTGGGNGRVRGE